MIVQLQRSCLCGTSSFVQQVCVACEMALKACRCVACAFCVTASVCSPVLFLSRHEYPQWRPQDLSRVFPSLEESGLELLRAMLQYDPARRISVSETCRTHLKLSLRL